jgi:hypothetical protein
MSGRVGWETAEGLVNHTVIRAVFLIVVFLVVLVIARLCCRWLELKILGDASSSA